MEIIELERWKPSADDPHKLEYAGQRTGREVFAELKQRLESLGLLPEEYFLIGRSWEHGEEIPKDADMFVTHGLRRQRGHLSQCLYEVGRG